MLRFALLLQAATLLLPPAALGADIVRDHALIASIPIAGITADMPPRQAFEQLQAQGYQAGPIDTFEAWEEDGVEFVRGNYEGADGFSSLTFSRQELRITNISQSWNRPRDHFDAREEIARVRRHFHLPEDTPGCRATSAASGTCRIQDAEDPQAVDLVFGLQVLPGMLIQYVESKKAHTGR